MGAATRRAFLGTLAAAAGACVLGGAVLAPADAAGLLRPPLVLDERQFASRCIRCYRCIEACHTRALVPAGLADGLLAARTPVLDFRRGSCDFCNECADACPTAAIVPADPLDPGKGRIGVAVVQLDRCVAFYNGCRECYRQCPYEAIGLSESGYPVVDESRCNGCGVCENLCPALVYRSFSGGTRRGIVVVRTDEEARAMRAAFGEGGGAHG